MMQDVAVIRIVIDDENTHALEINMACNFRLQGKGTDLDPHREPESTALS